MLKNINPDTLQITDMRFVDLVGCPMDCTIMRLDTNQGVYGYGEVRDFSNKFYALELKRLIVGENPLNINKIFNKIKQFGTHARGGGGVSAIEIACWDIAGKVYEVPVYQMLGGRTRDKIRLYCDTDIDGKNTGKAMAKALKSRMKAGFTILKMDLGASLLIDIPGTLSGPLGYVEKLRELKKRHAGNHDKEFIEFNSVPHPFTGLTFTEKGLDWLENYVKVVRQEIGYDVPIAVDHLGHVNYQSCLRLAKRLEKYNILWMEDCIPWFYTDQWKTLSDSTTVPMCTGEDQFGHESFKDLIDKRAVSFIHPDVLTTGGISETMKIINMAEEKGIAACIHMAETPIAAMAAASVAAAAGDNFLALEFHAHDVKWWNDLVKGGDKIVKNGYLYLNNKPGLGIPELDEKVLKAHMNPDRPGLWKSTEEWDKEWAHDRIWS